MDKGYQINRVHVSRKNEVEAYLKEQVAAKDIRYKNVTTRFVSLYFTASSDDWQNRLLYDQVEHLRKLSTYPDNIVPRYHYDNGGFSRILPAYTQQECDAYLFAHNA